MCSNKLWLILGLAIMLECCQLGQAEVGGRTRSTAAYPARGYRPQRRFNLPNEPTQAPAFAGDRDEDVDSQQLPQPRRPDFTYGVPPAARPQQQPQQQEEETENEQYFFVPRRNPQRTARLMNTSKPSARLAENSEANMDEEPDAEVTTDIEVGNRSLQPQPQPQPQPAHPQATTVYYPAGAVSFVQPLGSSFAQPLAPAQQPQQPLKVAKLQAQTQAEAMAMFAPAAAPVQAAFYASPATAAYTAAPIAFTNFPTAPNKLQAAPQQAAFGFSPVAAYTASPATAAAFTAPSPPAVAAASPAASAYVQAPYYFTAPAQLQQAW